MTMTAFGLTLKVRRTNSSKACWCHTLRGRFESLGSQSLIPISHTTMSVRLGTRESRCIAAHTDPENPALGLTNSTRGGVRQGEGERVSDSAAAAAAAAALRSFSRPETKGPMYVCFGALADPPTLDTRRDSPREAFPKSTFARALESEDWSTEILNATAKLRPRWVSIAANWSRM